MDAQQLYRLIVLDHQLSSRGVELLLTAEELGVEPETILRDLELLNSVGCEIVCREVDSERRGFYLGERLFNVKHDTVHLSALLARHKLTEDEDPLVMNEAEQGAASLGSCEPPRELPVEEKVEQ